MIHSSRYLRPIASSRHGSGDSSVGSTPVAQLAFAIITPTCITRKRDGGYSAGANDGEYLENSQKALPSLFTPHV